MPGLYIRVSTQNTRCTKAAACTPQVTAGCSNNILASPDSMLQRRNDSAACFLHQAKTLNSPMSTTPIATSDASADPRKDSLIEYPSLFPIKVMGLRTDDFAHQIAQVARQFDPFFDPGTIEQRPSSSGKYLGLTITITATSREQLDGLYMALTSHHAVKVVL